jgi:hypothetical protein
MTKIFTQWAGKVTTPDGQVDGKSAMGPFFSCLPFGPMRKRWMMARQIFLGDVILCFLVCITCPECV